MNQLSNCRKAQVHPHKLVQYLLNPKHPKGGPKALFFSRFGFGLSNFEACSKALLTLACSGAVVEIEKTEFGKSYRVQGNLQTPDGRNPAINSIWMIDTGSTTPRFITAYPI